MTHNEIEKLVISAKEGSIDAENELYMAFIPYINMLVSKFRIKGYDRDDLTNECYLAFNKALQRYAGTSTFVSYVTKCLKNHILLLLRYSVKMEEITLVDDIFADTSDVELEIFNKLAITSLSTALKTLSTRELEIIRDYYFNDLSLVSISKVIDAKYITTVKIKDRAIDKLRKVILE